MTDHTVLGTSDALCQEMDEIERRRHRRIGSGANGTQDDLETQEQRAQRLSLSALCLSGGGIRSAAFCLGVLQALAAKHMLRHFDYLSTVSGGGFIGGWLQVLIRESGSVSSVETAISQQRPTALKRLRAYTNYLTPQTGPLSVDTWAAAVLYLRNLLINWAVFWPLFFLLTLVPISYRTAISICTDCVWVNHILLVCAGLSLLYGVVRACTLLPSHRPPSSADGRAPRYASASSIRSEIVYPALGWTLLIPWLLEFAETRLQQNNHTIPWLAHYTLLIVPLVYFALLTFGFGLAWWLQSRREDPGIELFKANFGRWMLASSISSLMTLVMIRIGASILLSLVRFHIDFATTLTVMAPLALSVVHVLQSSLYVALRRETELADLDREWLGRVNAMILRIAVSWTIFALCCLVLAVLLYVDRTTNPNHVPVDVWNLGWISGLGGTTAVIGGLAAWLGKIWAPIEALAQKPATWDRVQAYLPAVLGALFTACLLIVFGGVLQSLLTHLQQFVGAYIPTVEKLQWPTLVLQAIVGVVLFIDMLSFSHVNVNRFSMHAVYRNRLTRAFLGSARSTREPDTFTGFDPADNMPLSDLINSDSSPFPVVNMTMNITAGSNMAWSERKAASFIATPLVCGSAELRHPSQDPREVDPSGAFVPTDRYAGLETPKGHSTNSLGSGLGFGSALTVSGAAVSPNWGYHSSRITAFLMTLFNVRLGAWVPNPSRATMDELRVARPRNSLLALLNELLGRTTDDSQAIYLSDGGHFENLGIYEMLRRRCSLIMVVDAGADDACSLFDLGNAIRRAEIDFGISVTLREPMGIYSRSQVENGDNLNPEPKGFAFGDIDYGAAHQGALIYLKPGFLQEMPTDVRAYAAEHKTFPHESTLDQWFTESQFDSYRMLGRYQASRILKDVQPGEFARMFVGRASEQDRGAAAVDSLRSKRAA